MNSENRILRIAITGPESTGKSTLARKLAEHYDTSWVPEFARNYIDQLGREYTEEDLLQIAKGQLQSEGTAIEEANRILFCDTELLVIKIWAKYKYGRVDPWILSKYHDVSYDYYLLTDVDLPWVDDPQRENPEKGKFFYEWFVRELKEKGVLFDVVNGNQHKRLEMAIQLINNKIISNSI